VANLNIEIPPPSVQSRWSTRDNNVRLRLALTGKMIVTSADRSHGKEMRFTRRINPGASHRNSQGWWVTDDSYALFELGSSPLTVSFERLQEFVTRLKADEEHYWDGRNNQRVFWTSSTDGLADRQSWYVDLKWGRDSKHWRADEDIERFFRVERVGGNHVNPWRIIGW